MSGALLTPFLFSKRLLNDAFESQIVAVIKENTLLTHPTINDMVNQSTGSVAGCSRHPDRLPKAPKQSRTGPVPVFRPESRLRLSYMAYTEQITFLLFLKMADEQTRPPYNRTRIVPTELG